MPQGFEIIRARTKDDAVVLIDRLMRSRQHEVVLVLPKNSIIVADLNSLKILKEEAESIGKILSLSTDNNEIKLFADKLGMSIYNGSNDAGRSGKTESVKSVKKTRIMTDIISPHYFNEAPKEEEILEPFPEMQQEEQEAEPTIYDAVNTVNKNSDLEKNLENFYINNKQNNSEINFDDKDTLNAKRNYFSLNALIKFFSISGLLIFAAAMYLILPKADIRVSLKEVPLKIQIPVAVSKSVNTPNLTSGIIPGQYFLLSKSGSKIIETSSSKIGGTIEIYNAYSVNPQKLVAQTRFETKDGKVFRIKNPVIVPGAKMQGAKLIPSSAKAEVYSDDTSSEYLIGPSYFTIPGFKETSKYAGFYAKSDQQMKILKSISLSNEDIEKNKKELQDKLAQELKAEILSTLNDSDLQLIDNASEIKINDFKVNANIINMKIAWQAMFFKEKDLRELINYFVSSHYPDLKNFTFKDNILYPKANHADFKKGELFFSFNIDKNNAFPADIDNLKKELVGRDENGMRAIISDKTYIKSATISLWPFWVKQAPNNLNKINIAIDSE